MTDFSLNIKKGEGLTQALARKAKEEGKNAIDPKNWNSVMDKLAEIQEKRTAEKIFTGGTEKKNWSKNFVVQEGTIKFSEEEMNELYKVMGYEISQPEVKKEEPKPITEPVVDNQSGDNVQAPPQSPPSLVPTGTPIQESPQPELPEADGVAPKSVVKEEEKPKAEEKKPNFFQRLFGRKKNKEVEITSQEKTDQIQKPVAPVITKTEPVSSKPEKSTLTSEQKAENQKVLDKNKIWLDPLKTSLADLKKKLMHCEKNMTEYGKAGLLTKNVAGFQI